LTARLPAAGFAWVSGSRAFLFPFLLVALLGLPARAALSVSPTVQEVLAHDTAPVEGAWRVTNTGPAPVRVRIAAVSREDYLMGNRDTGSPDWLRVLERRVVLGAGAETRVAFRASLPPGGRGERIAIVFFAEESLGGAATVQGRIGTAFYLMAAGSLEPRIEILSFALAPDRVRLELVNTGNVHLRPEGEFALADSAGRILLERVPLPPGMAVLPGARERYGSASFPSALPPDTYTVRYRIRTGVVDGKPGPVLAGERTIAVR